MSLRETLVRWVGLLSVGGRRAIARATHTARQRVRFSVLGIAIAIALLVVVTGIGLGLATGATVYDDDIDYWVVPEDGGERSSLVATDGPQFAAVHATTDQLRANEDIESATPVLSEVLRVTSEDGAEWVLVVGVINGPGLESITGVDTTPLTDDDPYYANGRYDGEWTGEIVLSGGAADLLGVTEGDAVTVDDNESFSVTAVDDGDRGVGSVPTAVVQLSELQTLTGARSHDQADQFVVSSNSRSVRDALAGLYPSSSVQTRGGLTAASTLDSGLPLALAVTAFVVALTIGTLFVVTTSGLELVADRRQLATMSALGLSTRSQLRIVGTQTVVTTLLGGIVGAVGGYLWIHAVNVAAVRTLTTEPIAVAHPLLIGYGIAVAALIGIVSLPVLLVATRRLTGGVPQ
jgi:putative ABC transport system permease protein